MTVRIFCQTFRIDVLFTCATKTKKCSAYPYQHWFVTDGHWIIEFGSGDGLENKVVIHSGLREGYIIAESFKMNFDVKTRMIKVCGATNYSLALRNCEHVARYRQSGV